MAYRTIPLTQGQVAIVSAQDWKRLSMHKWWAKESVTKHTRTWYARRSVGPKGKQRYIWMHREIAGAKAHEEVDHKDGNGLHNWRRNLRCCTRRQNMCNARQRVNTSGYIGVCAFPKNKINPWTAQLSRCHRTINLGYFPTAIAAAVARDKAAIKEYGKFARLNFPRRRK